MLVVILGQLIASFSAVNLVFQSALHVILLILKQRYSARWQTGASRIRTPTNSKRYWPQGATFFKRGASHQIEGAEIIENYDSFIFQDKRYLAVVAGIIGVRRARLPDFGGNNAARAGARRPEALPCLESQNGTWNRLTTARPLTRLEPMPTCRPATNGNT